MCTSSMAKHRHLLLVTRDGQVVRTDNRKRARLTKLVGVPVAHADVVGIIPE